MIQRLRPLLQVGFIRFNGNIYQFLENCQQYVGGWAYERANGNFGLRSFYAATGQDIQAKLNPSDFAYDSDTSRFQSQPDMVKNTHRLITTVVDADLSRSPTVLARARIDLNLQEGVGSGDRTTRVVDLDDTVIVEVQTKSNDWGSILSHIEATYREPENDEDVKPRFVAEFLQPEGVTTRIPGEPYRRDKINKVDIYRVAIVPVDEVVRRQRWTITFYGYEYEVLDSNAHDIEPDTGEVDEALHWSREHYGLREYCSPKWWPNNDSATYSIARDYLEVLSRPLQLITLNMPRWTAPKSEFSTMTPQQIHEQLSDIDTGHVVEVFSQSVDGITLLSKVLVLCVRYWHEVERVPYKSICGVALDPLQGISSVWQPFPSIPTKVGTATWQSRQGSIAGTGPRPTRTAFDDGFDDGFS